MGLDHATVRSRVFWGLRYSPVPNLRTGPYRSPDQTGLQNHTSVRSQNSGPDRLQISPVRSSPSPTVRSGQSSHGQAATIDERPPWTSCHHGRAATMNEQPPWMSDHYEWATAMNTPWTSGYHKRAAAMNELPPWMSDHYEWATAIDTPWMSGHHEWAVAMNEQPSWTSSRHKWAITMNEQLP
jgi:hypothetical protein